MRCNSSGDLYPVCQNTKASTPLQVPLATLSLQDWHSRLGHPRDHAFNFLSSSNLISCNKEQRSKSLSYSQIAKHKCYLSLRLSLLLRHLLVLFIVIFGLIPCSVKMVITITLFCSMISLILRVCPLKQKSEVFQ